MIELFASLPHSTSVVEPRNVEGLEAPCHSFHSVILFLVEVLRIPEGQALSIGCVEFTL